jgi:KDO2-lipid IV(A) lauroyltransferase
MKKDFIADYFGCITIKLLGPLIRSVPRGLSLFLGKKLGEFLYYFDLKHKAITHANIKTALGQRLSPRQIRRITKEFYRSFGQDIIEIFFIPLVNKKYMDKYISIQGLEYVEQGFKKGKGVILLGVHAGSWELSNIICANLGFPFSLFIRDQRHPRLNKLLNSYRSQMGCRIIGRKNGARQLIQALRDNQSIGMTADQGGKSGVLVKFFGKEASMPSGAIKLALKYDTAIIPGFYTRINGPYIRTFLEPPFKIIKTGNLEKDIQDNLQELTHIFERYIEKYPREYLWSYKIWKYSHRRNLLILSDGKTGHLRQSQFLAKTMGECLKAKSIQLNTQAIEVKFKNKFSQLALLFSSGLSGRYHCQGCLWCLRRFLTPDSYKALLNSQPDYILSSGSSLAAINFILARENNCKSIVNMRPSILSTNRFDLVIMPRHDRPPKRKNVVVTDCALNIINQDYLREQKEEFLHVTGLKPQPSDLYLGLLVGGDTKKFSLKQDVVSQVIQQIKSVAQTCQADILVTTSRRTPEEVEKLVKDEFKDYPSCKVLIIANEKNIPSAMGGILGLSKILIVSPESISMISEAVASERCVLVFKSAGLDEKHERFLDYFSKNKYIHLVEARDIRDTAEDILRRTPKINTLKDNIVVRKAIERLI